VVPAVDGQLAGMMQGSSYLYMEDRGQVCGPRWGTPVTPTVRKVRPPHHSEGLEPRNLIAVNKASLGVSSDWREKTELKYFKKKESSIRVVARFRPSPKPEREAQDVESGPAFTVSHNGRTVESFDGVHCFEFDLAFQEDSTQEAVYSEAGLPVINDLLDGYNGTIFAYGQTGSGKTHCMFGSVQDILYQTENRGVLPRAAEHVFAHIREGAEDVEFVLKCSLFEVYREQLRDLLDPSNVNLKVKETPRHGVYVNGLTQEFVAHENDVWELLRLGCRSRSVAATRLNQQSSRSHVIFSLTCEQRLADDTKKRGKLNLVDLAGSEKVWKSSSSGVTLEEAKNINRSLSALGNVINALAERRPHVPYRDSKLTRILQETLGGNCKTALIVTCSQQRRHLDESLSSLNFATRAKSICNHVKMNFVYSAEQLMGFVERLQQELKLTRHAIAKAAGTGTPRAAAAAASVSPRLREACGGGDAGAGPAHLSWNADLMEAGAPADEPAHASSPIGLLDAHASSPRGLLDAAVEGQVNPDGTRPARRKVEVWKRLIERAEERKVALQQIQNQQAELLIEFFKDQPDKWTRGADAGSGVSDMDLGDLMQVQQKTLEEHRRVLELSHTMVRRDLDFELQSAKGDVLRIANLVMEAWSEIQRLADESAVHSSSSPSRLLSPRGQNGVSLPSDAAPAALVAERGSAAAESHACVGSEAAASIFVAAPSATAALPAGPGAGANGNAESPRKKTAEEAKEMLKLREELAGAKMDLDRIKAWTEKQHNSLCLETTEARRWMRNLRERLSIAEAAEQQTDHQAHQLQALLEKRQLELAEKQRKNEERRICKAKLKLQLEKQMLNLRNVSNASEKDAELLAWVRDQCTRVTDASHVVMDQLPVRAGAIGGS